METDKKRSTMSSHWKIKIEALRADYYRLFRSRDPFDVMATLDGRAKLTLQFDLARKPVRQKYTGCYATKVWIRNYRDEDVKVRMRNFGVVVEDRLILRLASPGQEQEVAPDEAFAVKTISREIRDSLQAYLTDRYAGRELHYLLPTLDVQKRLEEQKAEAAEFRRLTDLLNRESDEDEADWWKREERPPY